MKKKTKKVLTWILLIGLLVFFGRIVFLALLNPTASQELTNFTNTGCVTVSFDYGSVEWTKQCVYESILYGLENSINVTFQVGLMSKGGWDSSCSVTAKVDAYNIKTNSYAGITEKTWTFGPMAGMTFAKEDASIPSYFNYDTASGCYSHMLGAGRPEYLCLRTKYFLDSDYMQDDMIKFRATVDNTCNFGYNYKIVEVGLSDWETGINVPPQEPEKPFWNNIVNLLITWLAKIFDYFFAIVGPVEVEPGSVQTYTTEITLDTPVDSDYSDGTVSYRWGSMALVDKNGNILQENSWKSIDNVYTDSITITVPSNLNNHAIISVVDEKKGVYDFDTKQWVWTEEVIAKEGINLQTKLPAPEPTIPILSSIIKAIQDFINWLINLFK